MGTIHRDLVVDAPAEQVWEALRDVGSVADLFPGVLTESRLDGATRVVVFANGMVIKERIVAVDDDRRRVAYSAAGEPFLHHHASMQVIPESAKTSRFVWISDFLPDEAGAQIEPLVDQGLAGFARRWKR